MGCVRGGERGYLTGAGQRHCRGREEGGGESDHGARGAPLRESCRLDVGRWGEWVGSWAAGPGDDGIDVGSGREGGGKGCKGVAPTIVRVFFTCKGRFGRENLVIGLLFDERLDLLELGVALLVPRRPYLVVEPRPLRPRHVPVDVLVVIQLVPVPRRLDLGEVSQEEQILRHGRPVRKPQLTDRDAALATSRDCEARGYPAAATAFVAPKHAERWVVSFSIRFGRLRETTRLHKNP